MHTQPGISTTILSCTFMDNITFCFIIARKAMHMSQCAVRFSKNLGDMMHGRDAWVQFTLQNNVTW